MFGKNATRWRVDSVITAGKNEGSVLSADNAKHISNSANYWHRQSRDDLLLKRKTSIVNIEPHECSESQKYETINFKNLSDLLFRSANYTHPKSVRPGNCSFTIGFYDWCIASRLYSICNSFKKFNGFKERFFFWLGRDFCHLGGFFRKGDLNNKISVAEFGCVLNGSFCFFRKVLLHNVFKKFYNVFMSVFFTVFHQFWLLFERHMNIIWWLCSIS